MKLILAIGFAVVLASFFAPNSAAFCDYSGTYQLTQYYIQDPNTKEAKEVYGPEFTLNLEEKEHPKVTGNFSTTSFWQGSHYGSDVDDQGIEVRFKGATPWPAKNYATDDGYLELKFQNAQCGPEVYGKWMPPASGGWGDPIYLKGNRIKSGSGIHATSPFVTLDVKVINDSNSNRNEAPSEFDHWNVNLEEAEYPGITIEATYTDKYGQASFKLERGKNYTAIVYPNNFDWKPADGSPSKLSRSTGVMRTNKTLYFPFIRINEASTSSAPPATGQIDIIDSVNKNLITSVKPKNSAPVTLSPGEKAEIDARCQELKSAVLLLFITQMDSYSLEGSNPVQERAKFIIDLIDIACDRLKSGIPLKITEYADTSSPSGVDYPLQLQLDLQQGAIKTEVVNDQVALAVETPTATVSSLGINTFGVAYDPTSGKSLISAYKGQIEVQPKNSNQAPFTLESGQEVEVDNGQVTSVTPSSQTPGEGIGKASGISILDHTMANQVDESTSQAVTRTNTFQPSDLIAYSWIQLGNVNDAHRVEWNWYAPDGKLIDSSSQDIPKPADKPWDLYNILAGLNIAGYYPANMPGSWHVDILLDGQKILTEQFDILGPGGATPAPSSSQIPGEETGQNQNPGSVPEGSEGGCYADPFTGEIVCIDSSGKPSESTGGLSGECYADPTTGEIVCVDFYGDSNQQGTQVGEIEGDVSQSEGKQDLCFEDPETSEIICTGSS